MRRTAIIVVCLMPVPILSFYALKAIFGDAPAEPAPPQAQPPPAAPRPAKRVSASEVYRDFDDNQVAARQKWGAVYCEFRITVTEIRAPLFASGTPTVSGFDADDMPVVCDALNSADPVIVGLHKGDKVRVRGFPAKALGVGIWIPKAEIVKGW